MIYIRWFFLCWFRFAFARWSWACDIGEGCRRRAWGTGCILDWPRCNVLVFALMVVPMVVRCVRCFRFCCTLRAVVGVPGSYWIVMLFMCGSSIGMSWYMRMVSLACVDCGPLFVIDMDRFGVHARVLCWSCWTLLPCRWCCRALATHLRYSVDWQ